MMPLALPETYNVRSLLGRATRQLAEAGIEQPKLDAMLLLAEAMEVTRESLYLRHDEELSPEVADAFEAMIARRAAREPVTKILGRKEFWSLDFLTGSATLDPRPDSETLIEALLDYFPDRSQPLRLLDLGTGTGCLLLSALSEYPNATGLGIDGYSAPLNVAQRNALRLGLSSRVVMQHGNWADAITERFDAILCNPPYIREDAVLMPEVARFDPAEALFAGPDGLDEYRRLLPSLARCLTPDGVAIFEIGQGQEAAVNALADASGLTLLTTRRDLANIPRALVFTHSSQEGLPHA